VPFCRGEEINIYIDLNMPGSVFGMAQQEQGSSFMTAAGASN
jgi:hypothetical protein